MYRDTIMLKALWTRPSSKMIATIGQYAQLDASLLDKPHFLAL